MSKEDKIEMLTVDIRDKAEEAFDNYAKELLLDRAFPDYRDGLIPVQRRILYGMNQKGLSYKSNGKPSRQIKSARIVGDVMGKYHPHGDCLHKDTKVYLASGETPTIKEMYDETQKDPSKTYGAYSVDENGKLVRSEISHVRIGQYADDIYEVKLSNGHVIRTTSNHPFLTYNNEWVKAEDLEKGTPLTNGTLGEYGDYPIIRVFNDRTKGTYELLKMVKEKILGEDGDTKQHLHHKNENKYDNRMENVELLSIEEHAKHHGNYLKALGLGRETMFSGEDEELRERIRIKNSRLMKSYNQKQYLHKAFQIIDLIKEDDKEVNNGTYNEYRTEIYNGTTVNRLKERGDINEDVSELLGKEFKLEYIEPVTGLTEDLKEPKEETPNNRQRVHYAKHYKVVDAVLEVIKKGIPLTTETYWEERVNQLEENYNKKNIVNIEDINEYLEEVNHEGVVYVEEVNVVKADKEPMYDFTVNEYENALFVANEGNNQFIVLHNSGIYGAMTKMAKGWVLPHPLVELIGNNGSSDGDNPASFRYTLARLESMASYLTDGLNKKGLVDWQLTYEDTDYEPKYLPAQYPNLLVNGSVGGIAIGFVVDILPHNLEEVLNVSIQDARGEELDPIAPDFPTGGVIVNGNELEEMYDKGIGRAVVRGRYKIETAGRRRKNKRSIVFYDVPYNVQKSKVVDKIQEMISNNGTTSKKQLVGAVKVQDESGSDGLRIVVNVTDDADIEVITELIYKHTQMEKTQRYEFLTILDGRPTRMSLKRYITEFNKFRRETIVREKVSDNKVIQTKITRLDALIKLDGIRDEVIDCIRQSDNKGHAVTNLVNQYDFSEEQAEYLLSLQLSRLTKDNYDKYKQDRDELQQLFDRNTALIDSPEAINEYMIAEYEELIKKEGKPRQTEVQSEVREVDLTIEKVIPLEDTVIGVTKTGHIKRSTPRSFGATKSVDFDVLSLKATTHDELLVFTDLGQVGIFKVNDIPEMRWGDEGEPLVTFARDYHIDERVIGIGLRDKINNLIFITNDNRVKVMLPTEFDFKTTNTFFNILPIERENGEQVIGTTEVTDNTSLVITATNKRKTLNYGLAFKVGDINPTGRSAKGRKLASWSKSKVFEDIYLSGELEEEYYRDVGRAPVKYVYPVDIDLETLKDSNFVSETIKITNEPEPEEDEDVSEEEEQEESVEVTVAEEDTEDSQ